MKNTCRALALMAFSLAVYRYCVNTDVGQLMTITVSVWASSPPLIRRDDYRHRDIIGAAMRLVSSFRATSHRGWRILWWSYYRETVSGNRFARAGGRTQVLQSLGKPPSPHSPTSSTPLIFKRSLSFWSPSMTGLRVLAGRGRRTFQFVLGVRL